MSETSTHTPELDASTRCDACGLSALVEVHHAAHGVLTFCGHHFHDHEALLGVAGWTVVTDNREESMK